MRESRGLGVNLGDAVPKPLGFGAFWLRQQEELTRIGRVTLVLEGHPAVTAVRRLQSALGLHPCRALPSAGAKLEGLIPVP